MSYILIAYDLKSANSERYQEIETFIKDNFSFAIKLLNTTWLVNTFSSSLEVLDLLKPILQTDKLVVTPANGLLCSSLPEDIEQWIKNNTSQTT